MNWVPEKAAEASAKVMEKKNAVGIYATDARPDGKKYSGQVMGQIYGWGRYVRGDKGWRAQFAYPKCFMLTESQVEFIEPLKAWRVPIYVEQPMRVYDPEEDGYGYGSNEENGDCGAAANPGAEEDSSSNTSASDPEA
jgi:hypothetical protein